MVNVGQEARASRLACAWAGKSCCEHVLLTWQTGILCGSACKAAALAAVRPGTSRSSGASITAVMTPTHTTQAAVPLLVCCCHACSCAPPVVLVEAVDLVVYVDRCLHLLLDRKRDDAVCIHSRSRVLQQHNRCELRVSHALCAHDLMQAGARAGCCGNVQQTCSMSQLLQSASVDHWLASSH
jgi:hypothetical protein